MKEKIRQLFKLDFFVFFPLKYAIYQSISTRNKHKHNFAKIRDYIRTC